MLSGSIDNNNNTDDVFYDNSSNLEQQVGR